MAEQRLAKERDGEGNVAPDGQAERSNELVEQDAPAKQHGDALRHGSGNRHGVHEADQRPDTCGAPDDPES